MHSTTADILLLQRSMPQLGIALDLVLYLKTQFNTKNKTRGLNLDFIPQVSNQVYNPGIIGYYTCRQV